MLNSREKFIDPSIITKIKEIEDSVAYKEKIDSLKPKMKERSSKLLKLLGLGIIVSFLLIRPLGYFAAVLFIAYASYLYKLYKENLALNNKDYVENFLLPTLKLIFPNCTIEYNGGINKNLISKTRPFSSRFYTSCHIYFNDENMMEFCNLNSCHMERRKNSKGKTRTSYDEVSDFYGQVFMAKLSSNIEGNIRILPTVSKTLFANKNHGYYGDKGRGESCIRTESIVFDEAYTIYATDQLFTKIILDPKIIEILNFWSKKMKLAIYIEHDTILAFFESHEFIFNTPMLKSDINKLSISNEYEKIRKKLYDFYNLIDIICENT